MALTEVQIAELEEAGIIKATSEPTEARIAEKVEQAIPWPAPLAKEAYHGLAGEFVKAIEPHTEADPAAILFQLLTAFGNAAGRNPHFEAEADRHGVNLFVANVGETAKGRKGVSWGQVKKLFEIAATDWLKDCLGHGLSSGEGLIWRVHDPIERMEPVKVKGHVESYETVIIDPGVDDKRLLVIESELASTLRVLSREGNTLSALIRNSWDGGDLQSMTKNSPAKATDAHISIIGHITRQELLRYLDNTEGANGFANRFLWICSRRSKCLPEGGRLQDVDFMPLIERLKKAIEFAAAVGEIKRNDEARAIWHKVYESLSDGKPGLFGAVTARAEAQVMRLACVYALLDRSDVIKKEHLLAGLALWDYAEASARYIFGDKLGDYEADAILDALRQSSDGLTKTQIHNLFGRNKSSAQIDRALGVLVEYGRARKEIEDTQPKPTERWFSV